MLESSFILSFFLKTPVNPNQKTRLVYMRIVVDGIQKEKSTKRKWDVDRWNKPLGRPIGTKEDARALNSFLDAMTLKVTEARTQLIQHDISITAERIMDIISGKSLAEKTKVLEEFQIHNDEIASLARHAASKEGYAKGTHDRYVTARSHVQQFIQEKYKREDLEFRELNFDFINSYYLWLRTTRGCSNNTSLKYIANFKKIIRIAMDKGLLIQNPFIQFKKRKTKIKKTPLSSHDLAVLEELNLTISRLEVVRDIFIFQCYTGLAYADVYKLKKSEIIFGIDGEKWISTARQKTRSATNLPLLPAAIRIMEKYKDDPVCIKKNTVLPVFSNQKMNAYLKEIADLAGLDTVLNTHKARRTFASTVALKNGVPIHVVRDILGHESVTQTEEYAISEQESISEHMQKLKQKLNAPPMSKKALLVKMENLQAQIKDLQEQMKRTAD